jgi:Fe-S-cluster containining protein
MFNNTAQNQDLDRVLPVEERPDLCHKCGKCCRSATTYHSYSELQKMVEEGEQEAIDFLEIFQPFASIDEARKFVPDQVEQVMRVISDREDMNVDDVTFYHCRYVTEEGLCGIYERRPRCCKDAPYHGWAVMPPGCGFEGWQFDQRESQKADIRKLKEVQFQMEMLSPDGIHLPTRNMTLDDLRASIEDSIKPWKIFGSEYW